MIFHAFMSLCVFTFVLAVFVAKCILETHLSVSLFSLSLTLLVFSFSSSIPTEKSQKIFLLSWKTICERKLSCTRLDFGEILLREQNGQSRVGFIAPSCPLG